MKPDELSSARNALLEVAERLRQRVEVSGRRYLHFFN